MRISSTLTLVTLLAGCMSVGGRIRPIWAPTWSTVAWELASPSSTSSVQVRAFLDGRQTLPGAEIVAVPTRGYTKALPWTPVPATTDSNGSAELKLPAGDWEIRCELVGLRPVKRRFVVQRGMSYKIEFFTVPSEMVVITEARPNSADQPATWVTNQTGDIGNTFQSL